MASKTAVPEVPTLQVDLRTKLFIKKAMVTSSPGLPRIPTRMLFSACIIFSTLLGDIGTHLEVSPNIAMSVPFL